MHDTNTPTENTCVLSPNGTKSSLLSSMKSPPLLMAKNAGVGPGSDGRSHGPGRPEHRGPAARDLRELRVRRPEAGRHESRWRGLGVAAQRGLRPVSGVRSR